MIKLNDNFFMIDSNDCPINLEYTTFNFKTKYKPINKALKIEFSDDFNYNINCIKKLEKFERKKLIFSTSYNGHNIQYIISNYNDDILTALRAISIHNQAKRIEYLYDYICSSLDRIWYKNNPCKFCNNICIASRNNMTAHKEDGCCYSFTYSKNPLKFVDNVKLCQYLGNDKKCSTQNISCKLFVCNYLKKEKLFSINLKDSILIQSFFSNKQKLVLKYNFFKSKQQIIHKLLEYNSEPFIFYYIFSHYRII